MTVNDALTLLVLVVTPLATMLAVRIQLAGEAERDVLLFRRQRLEGRDANLRAAYAKILRAAEVLDIGVRELNLYPKGRPYIEHQEVFADGVVQTQQQYVSVPPELGDYSRVQELLDEANRLRSEARIDIGVEHDHDTCLDFFEEHFYRVFRDAYLNAMGDGTLNPDFPKIAVQLTDDQVRLAALARENRQAILDQAAIAARRSWWQRLRGAGPR